MPRPLLRARWVEPGEWIGRLRMSCLFARLTCLAASGHHKVRVRWACSDSRVMHARMRGEKHMFCSIFSHVTTLTHANQAKQYVHPLNVLAKCASWHSDYAFKDR